MRHQARRTSPPRPEPCPRSDRHSGIAVVAARRTAYDQREELRTGPCCADAVLPSESSTPERGHSGPNRANPNTTRGSGRERYSIRPACKVVSCRAEGDPENPVNSHEKCENTINTEFEEGCPSN